MIGKKHTKKTHLHKPKDDFCRNVVRGAAVSCSAHLRSRLVVAVLTCLVGWGLAGLFGVALK